MKQALVLTLLSVSSSFAVNILMQEANRNALSAAPVVVERVIELEAPPAEERVIDLPDDGHTWHTILILRPDWKSTSAERRAEAMFHSEPLLVSLKRQTHWHLITTDQPEFQAFRPLVGATPCLIIERANGEVVYRESGPELGKQPHSLTRAIRREIQRHCPDGRCLPLHPVPDREEERRQPDEIPAVLQEPSDPAQDRTSTAAILAALAGLAAGVAGHWKRTG